MNLAELAEVVRTLTQRLEILEAAAPPTSSGRGGHDLAIVQSVLAGLPVAADGSPMSGAVVYAGAVPGDDGTVAWQMERDTAELVSVEPIAVANTMNALGNSNRVQIIQILLHGPATTASLTDRLDGPSAGQLFHHLKELLAAGLVHQPQRGTYAIRPQLVVPLLALLSCTLDLSSPQAAGTTAPT